MSKVTKFKRLTGLCILISYWVLSLSCSKPTTQAGISVPNGDFEAGGLTPWAPFQAVQANIATDPVHGGKFSVSEAVARGSVYQDVKGLQAGVSYIASAWVSGSTDATAGAMIGVFDPGTNEATFSPTIPPKPTWQKLEYEFKVSQQTARIHLFRGDGNGTLFWDDLRILPKQ